MEIVIVLLFLLPVFLVTVAWYVVSSIIAYKYVKACNGAEAWMVWLPLSVRSSVICLASDNIHPLDIPRGVIVTLGLLTLISIPFSWVPYVGWLVVAVSWLSMIALFVLNCIYIYNVASDLDEPAVLYVILFILFCGLVEPFILHSLRKGIEEGWK